MRLRTGSPNGGKDRSGSRLTRCYVDAPLAVGQQVALSESASTHLVRVLRLGLGEACVVFNGDGADYDARLVSLGKRSAEVEIMARRELANESPLRITLVQAIARGEKMDWVLQKATELGVARVAPIATERTEVRLDAERGEKRLAHWQGVIAAACEQSGRARVPPLSPPLALREWLVSDPMRGWFLDPHAEDRIGSIAPPPEFALVIGPEGGLSERDLDWLRAAGFRGLRLGPRVLRTETAGPAAIAALQARFGDCS